MVGVDLDKVVGATPSVSRCVPAEQIEDQDPGPGGARLPGPDTRSESRAGPGTSADRLARVLAALSQSMDVGEPEGAGVAEADGCGVDAVHTRLALMGLSLSRRDGPERPPKRGDGPERPPKRGDGPERPPKRGDGPARSRRRQP